MNKNISKEAAKAAVAPEEVVNAIEAVENDATPENKTSLAVSGYDKDGAALVVASGGQVSLETLFTDVSNVFFSSIVDDGNPQTKIKIYNAMNFTEGPFKLQVKPVVISDIIAHNITLMDEQTGEMVDAIRVVLVTPEGKGYHAVSTGLMSSVQKIVGMFGRAPWVPNLVVMPRRVPTRRGFETLTIDVIDVVYPKDDTIDVKKGDK